MTNLDEITENYEFFNSCSGKVEVTSNIPNAVIFKVSLHTFKFRGKFIF